MITTTLWTWHRGYPLPTLHQQEGWTCGKQFKFKKRSPLISIKRWQTQSSLALLASERQALELETRGTVLMLQSKACCCNHSLELINLLSTYHHHSHHITWQTWCFMLTLVFVYIRERCEACELDHARFFQSIRPIFLLRTFPICRRFLRWDEVCTLHCLETVSCQWNRPSINYWTTKEI